MNLTKSSRNCISNKYSACCDKQHFMRKMNDFVRDWFVVSTSDFIDMWRHHKKHEEKVCDIVCPSDEMCELHKKLKKMTGYVKWVRDKNLNCKYEVIKTIGVVFFQKFIQRKSVLVDQDYWMGSNRTSKGGFFKMEIAFCLIEEYLFNIKKKMTRIYFLCRWMWVFFECVIIELRT